MHAMNRVFAIDGSWFVSMLTAMHCRAPCRNASDRLHER